MDFDLVRFIAESNRIEGIFRVIPDEIEAHSALLARAVLSVEDLEAFVNAVARAPLRRSKDMDVQVGIHVAPRGGPKIEEALSALLAQANQGFDPHDVHHRYEDLHPFMDGNGRSGRAIWLWMMRRQRCWVYQSSFLQTWYYQSLDCKREVD